MGLSAGGSWTSGDRVRWRKSSERAQLWCTHLDLTQVDTVWPGLLPSSGGLLFPHTLLGAALNAVPTHSLSVFVLSSHFTTFAFLLFLWTPRPFRVWELFLLWSSKEPGTSVGSWEDENTPVSPEIHPIIHVDICVFNFFKLTHTAVFVFSQTPGLETSPGSRVQGPGSRVQGPGTSPPPCSLEPLVSEISQSNEQQRNCMFKAVQHKGGPTSGFCLLALTSVSDGEVP